MSKPKRSAAIYTRTNQSNQTARTQSQIELCLSVAKSKGFSENEIHIYKDEVVLGNCKSPPALKQLLAAIPDYAAVFVSQLNRISRNTILFSSVARQISDSGATLWSCDPAQQIPINETFFENRLSILLKPIMEQMEHEHRSTAAKRGHATRRRAKQIDLAVQGSDNHQLTQGDSHDIQKI